MARVEISDLQPFNESAFYDCTYPIRFTVLRHYGRPIAPVVFNEEYRFACAYESKHGWPLLCFTTHSIDELDTLLTRTLGIVQTKHFRCTDVLADLEYSLSVRQPVMLMIDRYFQSYVPQYYQREHFLHYILVYGYDSDTRTVLLFDDLCRYQCPQIVACSAAYEEIVQANAGCSGFGPEDINGMPEFIAFSADDRSIDSNAVSSQFREASILHLLSNRTEIEESIGNLTRFTELFGDGAAQGEPSEMLRYYYHVFRRVAEIKETQCYQLKCLLNGYVDSESATTESYALIRAWNILRTRTLRAAADPNPATVRAYVSDVSTKLQAVIPLEKAQQTAFFGALERIAQRTNARR